MPHADKLDHKEFFDLYDIFNIIWKWKFLIIGGTVFFGILAAVISLNTKKIFEVKATIRPGILTINKSGKIAYYDRADNIAMLIQSGAINSSIQKKMKSDGIEIKSTQLRFTSDIPGKSQTINISFETPDIEYGKQATNALLQVLEEKYLKRTQYVKKQNKMKGEAIESKMQSLEMKKDSEQRKIELFNSRTNDLRNAIAAMGKDKNDIDHLALKNAYKRELFENYLELEKLQQTKLEIELRLSDEVAKIATEESKNDISDAIQIIQKPYSNSKPVKPKIKSNITLASFTGFFVMVFITFLLELKISKRR